MSEAEMLCRGEIVIRAVRRELESLPAKRERLLREIEERKAEVRAIDQHLRSVKRILDRSPA